MARANSDLLEEQQLNDHLAAIRKLEKQVGQSREDILRARVETGGHLLALKAGVDQGDWLPTLSKVAIHKRTAQRLMRIADSALGAEIRAAARFSLPELPLDLGILELFAKLPRTALKKAMKWPFGDLETNEIRKRIKALMVPKSGAKPKAQNRAGSASSDSSEEEEQSHDHKDQHDAKNQNEDDNEEEEQADGDAGTDKNAEAQSAEQYADDSDQLAHDPVIAIAGIVEQLSRQLLDDAVRALEAETYDPEYLATLSKTLAGCRRRLQVLQAAVDSAVPSAFAGQI